MPAGYYTGCTIFCDFLWVRQRENAMPAGYYTGCTVLATADGRTTVTLTGLVNPGTLSFTPSPYAGSIVTTLPGPGW